MTAIKKIVIVEDNSSLAEIYKTRLELLGYKCYIASEGIQALAIIESERPDLVLLDIMMPKMSGDQILENMRKNDWGKDVKVYIISNLNQSEVPGDVTKFNIEGYSVKSNLANDDIDQIVKKILSGKI